MHNVNVEHYNWHTVGLTSQDDLTKTHSANREIHRKNHGKRRLLGCQSNPGDVLCFGYNIDQVWEKFVAIPHRAVWPFHTEQCGHSTQSSVAIQHRAVWPFHTEQCGRCQLSHHLMARLYGWRPPYHHVAVAGLPGPELLVYDSLPGASVHIENSNFIHSL